MAQAHSLTVQLQRNDILMMASNDTLGLVGSGLYYRADEKALLVRDNIDMDWFLLRETLRLSDNSLRDWPEHLEAKVRIAPEGAKGGGNVQSAQAIGARYQDSNTVLVNVGIDPYGNGLRVTIRQERSCRRRGEGNGDRFRAAKG
ncbi:MAG: hypothetical protein HY895_13150 [Deltaproteobacteria bacterium]|nr:hypothetical protein [Deltaproteobacteria bacterium]